jgi:ankyrin repeat protein
MGRRPAHLAAQGAGDGAESVILGTNSHLNCLTVLRQFGMLDIDVEDDRGMTPLLAACEKGASVAAQWLLERGANCYKGDRTKRNALHLAVAKNHRRTIRLLAYFDSDESRLKNAQDWKGRKPEEMARTLSVNNVLYSHDEIADDFATIWEASRLGDIDQLLRALRAGTDIDALSPAGWTATMYAAVNGHSALMRHLLSLRCQCDPPVSPGNGLPNVPAAPRISRPQLKDAQGCGPLHLAAQKGHADICQLLIRQGRAQVELRSTRNFTPLMYACLGGHLTVLQTLVSLRANLESNVDGEAASPSRCLFHLLATGKTEGHAACIQWAAAHLDASTVAEMLDRSSEAQNLLPPLRLAAPNSRVFHALERAMRDTRHCGDVSPIAGAASEFARRSSGYTVHVHSP